MGKARLKIGSFTFQPTHNFNGINGRFKMLSIKLNSLELHSPMYFIELAITNVPVCLALGVIWGFTWVTNVVKATHG